MQCARHPTTPLRLSLAFIASAALKRKLLAFLRHRLTRSNRETFQSSQIVPDNALVQRSVIYYPRFVVIQRSTHTIEIRGDRISHRSPRSSSSSRGISAMRTIKSSRHSRKGKLDFKAARDFRNTRQGQRTDLTTA